MRADRAGFGALLLLLVLPLVVGAAFVTTDGQRHVQMIHLARTLLQDPAAPESAFYQLQGRFLPNLGWYALCAPLSELPPLLADKIVVLVYLLGLPLAFRWAVLRAAPDAGPLTWLAFPLLYSLLLSLGLMNFLHSLVPFLLAVGLAVTWEARPRGVAQVALAGVLLVISHPLTFYFTGAAVGLVVLWRGLLERDVRTTLARLAWTGLGFLPSLGLASAFVFEQGQRAATLRDSAVTTRLGWLASMDVLLTHGPAEILPALLLLVVFLALGAAALRRRLASPDPQPTDGWLVVAVFALIFFLVVPDQLSGGSLVARRSQIFVWLPLALWLAVQPIERTGRRAAGVAVALATTIQVLAHASAQRALDADRAELHQVAVDARRGDTVLPVVVAPVGVAADGTPRIGRVAPFGTQGADLANHLGTIDLTNWHAAFDFYPVRYRDETNPYLHLGVDVVSALRFPPPVQLRAYEASTGVRIDHVVVFGVTPGREDDPDVRAILDQLEDGWVLTRTSTPRGLARWYDRAP